jgi:hypothetical protein
MFQKKRYNHKRYILFLSKLKIKSKKKSLKRIRMRSYKNGFLKLRLDNLSVYKRFFSFVFFSTRKRNRRFFRLISFKSLFYTFIKFYKTFLRKKIYSFVANLYLLKNNFYNNFFLTNYLNKLLLRFFLFKKFFFSKYIVYFMLRYFLVFLLNYIELSNFRDEFYKWNWKERNFIKIFRKKRKKFNIFFFSSHLGSLEGVNKNINRFMFTFLSRTKKMNFFKEQDAFYNFLRVNIRKIYRFFFSNRVKNSKHAFNVENKFFFFKNSYAVSNYNNSLVFWFSKYSNRKN